MNPSAPDARSPRFPAPPQFEGQALIGQIESLDLEGGGVARLDGKVAFIEGALPGETVRWLRQRAKARFDTGRLLEVLRPSSQRTAPECPHFGLEQGSCGGCSMQHLQARAQVSIKQRMLEETLARIGHVRPEMILRPIVGPAWHYRQRARLTARYVERKQSVLVGFHERSSSYVADMRQCKVLARPVGDLLPALRELLGALTVRSRVPQIEVAVAGGTTVLVLRVLEPPSEEDRDRLKAFGRAHGVRLWLQPGGPDSAAPMDPGEAGADRLALSLAEFGVELAFRPTDFTQVNHAMNEVLVRRALALLAAGAADCVADFFCGMGNFTLPLATRAKRVFGLEGNGALLARAAASAADAGVGEKVRFTPRNLFEWRAQDWKALCEAAGGPIARVLVDPPRDGALAVAQSLAECGAQGLEPPRRLVYVSCNPSTLARDCSVLVNVGGWKLRAAGVINMFPHTSHVESIAMLEPPDAGADPGGAPLAEGPENG